MAKIVTVELRQRQLAGEKAPETKTYEALLGNTKLAISLVNGVTAVVKEARLAIAKAELTDDIKARLDICLDNFATEAGKAFSKAAQDTAYRIQNGLVAAYEGSGEESGVEVDC